MVYPFTKLPSPTPAFVSKNLHCVLCGKRWSDLLPEHATQAMCSDCAVNSATVSHLVDRDETRIWQG